MRAQTLTQKIAAGCDACGCSENWSAGLSTIPPKHKDINYDRSLVPGTGIEANVKEKPHENFLEDGGTESRRIWRAAEA